MGQRFELLLQALAFQRQLADSVIDQLTVRCRDVVDHRADLLINCTQSCLEPHLGFGNLSDLAAKLFIQCRCEAFVSVVTQERFVERYNRIDDRLFQQVLVNSADLTDMSAVPDVSAAGIPKRTFPSAVLIESFSILRVPLVPAAALSAPHQPRQKELRPRPGPTAGRRTVL